MLTLSNKGNSLALILIFFTRARAMINESVDVKIFNGEKEKFMQVFVGIIIIKRIH